MAKINPVIYTPFVQEKLIETNNIISLGVVDVDTNPPFKKKGEEFDIPVQQALDVALPDATQITSSSTTITPTSLSDIKVVTKSIEIGGGITASEFEDIRRGASSIKSIGGQIGTWMLNQTQDWIKCAIKGVFATAGALTGTHSFDYSATGDGVIDLEAVTNTLLLFGEQLGSFDTMIVNSKIYTDLYQKEKITWDVAESYSDILMKSGKIPVYMGMRLVMNDTICASYTHGVSGDTVYPTYLTSQKPIYLGYQRNLRMASETKGDKGGITNELYWYLDFGVGIKGVSYTESSNPTKDLLKAAGSWTKEYQDKNIRILELITK